MGQQDSRQMQKQTRSNMSVKSYVLGFTLSLILTILPITLVLHHAFGKASLLVAIMLMAVLQFMVQLFFFMQIQAGDQPRYNIMAFILGAVFVITIVAGSVWIMTFNSVVQ
jgi:cytochrome o ubiquinol oxidase operon protein cyoD